MDDSARVAAYMQDNEALCATLELPQGTLFELTLLARGEYNENYLFTHPRTQQKLIFRVNLGSQMHLHNQIGYEAHALTLLAPSKRTPLLHYVDPSKHYEGKGVLIEDWLPGVPLKYESDLTEAARILADVHSVPLDPGHGLLAPDNPLGAMLEECETMFDVYLQWSGVQTGLIKRVKRWFSCCQESAQGYTVGGTRHIISTELNANNFLIVPQSQINQAALDKQPRRSSLIDWEKPLAAEVEQDLAHFMVPTTTYWKTDVILTARERTSFLESYQRAVGLRFDTDALSERLERYLPMSCLRGITWSAMALAQHESGERLVADSYTLKRIKTFLNQEFLERVEAEYFR